MELHQVRYFLKAGETLNFTRAAEQCGVSVPSLSRAVHQLEEELGGQLFRRERHLTHLTDLGRLMLEHFTRLNDAAEAATRDASEYAKLNAARLKLGIFASMGGVRSLYYVPKFPIGVTLVLPQKNNRQTTSTTAPLIV